MRDLPGRDLVVAVTFGVEVAKDLKHGPALLPSTVTVWPHLTELFDIINRGSPPLKVATFNGGLFDPERHPFLEQCAVGDFPSQQAIDKLARVAGEFVDYRDLSERQLGTIYEGQGGAEGLGELLHAGVHHTVYGRAGGGAAAGRGAGEGRAQRGGGAGPAVLDLNILDCAMGSGHFLVEAVEYLARRLVEADVLPTDLPRDAGFDELTYWKRRAAQSCIYGVDLNPWRWTWRSSRSG